MNDIQYSVAGRIAPRRAASAEPLAVADRDALLAVRVGTSLAEVERRLIAATLRSCGGNKTQAAAVLGISLKTLYNRLNEYRRQPPREPGVGVTEGEA